MPTFLVTDALPHRRESRVAQFAERNGTGKDGLAGKDGSPTLTSRLLPETQPPAQPSAILAVEPIPRQRRQLRREADLFISNMKALQRALLGKALGNRRASCRYVDEAKRPVAIVAAVHSYLRAAQGDRSRRNRRSMPGVRSPCASPGFRLSTYKNGRFLNVGAILDLRDKKIGDVRARYNPISPVLGLSQNFEPSDAGPVRQNPGTDDRPIKFALPDQTLLLALVGISAANTTSNGSRCTHGMLGRLSPAPKPVTQMRRLTPCVVIASISTRVASENRCTG